MASPIKLVLPFLAVLILLSQPVPAKEMNADGNCYNSSYSIEHGSNRLAMTERFANRLDLSKEQRKALDEVADKHHSDLSDLQQLMADNGRVLAKMQVGDPKLRELTDAQGKTIADLIIVHKQIRADVDQVLTDAQREKLDRLEAHARLMRSTGGGHHCE